MHDLLSALQRIIECAHSSSLIMVEVPGTFIRYESESVDLIGDRVYSNPGLR